MDSDIFEETKEQITKVQLWIAHYNLTQQRLRNNHENYTPPQIYFILRNHGELLRINKLRLNQVKNSIDAQLKKQKIN